MKQRWRHGWELMAQLCSQFLIFFGFLDRSQQCALIRTDWLWSVLDVHNDTLKPVADVLMLVFGHFMLLSDFLFINAAWGFRLCWCTSYFLIFEHPISLLLANKIHWILNQYIFISCTYDLYDLLTISLHPKPPPPPSRCNLHLTSSPASYAYHGPCSGLDWPRVGLM